jgi:hypothetical protein
MRLVRRRRVYRALRRVRRDRAGSRVETVEYAALTAARSGQFIYKYSEGLRTSYK